MITGEFPQMAGVGLWRFAPGAEHLHAGSLPYRTPREVISLHLGYPDPRTFPASDLGDVLSAVLKEDDRLSLQYCEEKGDLRLRSELATWHRVARGAITEENVLITQGTTEALELLSNLFLTAGDVVVMEAPTYLWAIRSFRLREAELIGIPTDNDGIRLSPLYERLQELISCQRRPKFLYVMTDFQNPSGHSMPLERRKDLLRMAHELRVPIIEDTPYLDLRYEGQPLPTLFDLDEHNVVIQARSFSKIIGPGTRLGWVVGERTVIDRLATVKQTGSCTLLSRAVAAYIREAAYRSCIENARVIYRRKRDSVQEALRALLPEAVHWESPSGGFYVWLSLPNEIDVERLYQQAAARGVLFLKGQDCFCDQTRSNSIRLSFSFETEERIVRGVALLADLLGSTRH